MGVGGSEERAYFFLYITWCICFKIKFRTCKFITNIRYPFLYAKLFTSDYVNTSSL